MVICTYSDHRADLLQAAITGACAQTAAGDEVLVVVDHNELLRARLAALDLGPTVRVTANDGAKGLSGARNSGVRAAGNEIVVFLDDDAVPQPGWLASMASAFRADDVFGVGGWVWPDWQTGPPAWWPATFNWVVGCSYAGLPAHGGELRNPIGASMALRRSAIERAGWFRSGVGRVDLRPLGCEETELCIKIRQQEPGARIIHDRQAVVHHHVPSERAGLRYFLRRCHAEGISKAIVAGAVGAQPALAAERVHALTTIPSAAWQDLKGSPAGPAKVAAAGLGLGVTTSGYLRGRRMVRKQARHRRQG